MEPRNQLIAGAETVQSVERNMSDAVMRGIVALPGSETTSRTKGDCRDFGGVELSRGWRVGCFIGWGSGTAWVLCLVGIGDDTPPT